MSKASKKVQVIPVSSQNAAWQNLAEDPDVTPRNDQKSDEVSEVGTNLLDYMNADEFIQLMKNKTNNDFGALWKSSKALALQLKASKSILTLNSYMCSGKSKNDVMTKLVETAKYVLAADYVYIEQYVADENALKVTHSNSISAIHSSSPLSSEMEAEVYRTGKLANVATANGATSSTSIKSLDHLVRFQSHYILCVPICSENDTIGVIKCCRGVPKGVDPQGSVPVPFDEQDEGTIGYIASSVGFILKHLSDGKSYSSQLGGPATSPSRSNSGLPCSKNESPTDHLNLNGGGASGFVGGKLSIDEVIQWIVNVAYTEFAADRVSVFSYNSEKSELECIVSQDAIGLSVPVKAGIAGHVFSTLAVANVPDVGADSRFFTAVDDKTKYKTKSILCAPITNSAGQAIGVLQMVNKIGGGSFSQDDEAKVTIFAKRISILLQVKYEMQSANSESSMFSSLRAVIYNILSAQSMQELLSVTKVTLGYLVDADYVKLFDIDKSGGTITLRRLDSDAEPPEPARGSGMQAVSSKHVSSNSSLRNGTSAEDCAGSEVITDVPREILSCIRTGDMTTFKSGSSAGSTPPTEFLPGLSPQTAVIYPVGSKVFAGNPCKQVLVVARKQSVKPFIAHEKQALDVFVELLGTSIMRFQKMQAVEQEAVSTKWELNMIVNALSLLHNYVMLLDDKGNITACNKSISDVVGSERKVNCHVSKWFDRDQEALLNDVLSVYQSGENVNKECVMIKNQLHDNGLFVSYQVVPVTWSGTVHQDTDAPLSTSEIGAVILIMHAHSNDEEGVKKLREVLAAKCVNTDSHRKVDVSTVRGTMDAVAQAICEIGGRFRLRRDEQKAINAVAANFMEVSRNLRVSLVGENMSAIVEEVSSPELSLTCDISRQIPDLFTWEFDVNLYKDGSTLRGILGRLFESMFNLEEIHVSKKTLAIFFNECEKHYHDNPFHNFYHITCVTHFSYMLINATNGKELLNNNLFYIFAIMASAVVHDIDHPGNSNLYEINSKSELALLYNDQSVLENHHCSMAFRVMRYHNADILDSLPPAAYKDVKKTMVSCILATDMSVHFELIDRIKKKVQDGWDISDANDILFYCRIMLHAADLSNPVRPFELSKLWASRISEEFNRQVDSERKQGLPILGFMITPDEKTLCKNEIGFASFVVAPMWRNLELLFPAFTPLVQQLNNNLDSWKALLDKITLEEESKAAVSNGEAAKPVSNGEAAKP